MSEFHIRTMGSCKDLLKNGFEFLEAARRCAGSDENGTFHIIGGNKPTMLPAATVVNAAFACEMFLKALLKKEGKPYPTRRGGHNLEVLFEKQSSDTKQKINDLIGYETSTGKPLFEHFVKNHPNDFTSIRYYVANSGWSEMSPVTIFTFAFNLGNIARLLIEQNN